MAGEEGVVSGVMLRVESEYLDSIRDKAYAIPGTASVELTAETYDMVGELLGFLRGMMWVMLGFGAAMALAIVFTVVTINVLERSREVATMRTMGEGRGRIAAMITIENMLLGLAGLLPGIGLGYALALFFFRLIQGDMFSFSVVIFPRTYALTAGIVILIMLISQLPSIRQVNRLDLARVIKEQVS
jgi:putative ABC transport system permease protein